MLTASPFPKGCVGQSLMTVTGLSVQMSHLTHIIAADVFNIPRKWFLMVLFHILRNQRPGAHEMV